MGDDRTMPSLALYHSPGACSLVCLVALEEAGLPYSLELVDFKAAAHKTPAYAAISPLGKVPALSVDGTIIVENSAIQTYIAALRPEAGLFPDATTPLDLARRQSGLSFCAANLHPIVRGLFNPARLTTGDETGVRTRAAELADTSFAVAERQLAASGWWLGRWSMIDVYLDWALSIARRANYDLSRYPALAGLHERLMKRPAFVKAMTIEAEQEAVLAQRRPAS
jgi:glutathione S-transferase